MKRYMTIITIATVLVTITGFSALAAGKALQNRQSQGQMNQRMGQPEGQMNQRMGPQGQMLDDAPDADVPGLNWRVLDLSDEQRTKIQELSQDVREKTADLRKDLKDAQQDLRDEIKEETVDQARIDKLLQEIADLKSQLEEATMQRLLAIKGVLTPEQLEKLAEAKAEREQGLLNDEQRDKIAEITKASQEAIQALRNELRDLRDTFQDLLIAKDTDQAQLKAVQEQIAAKEAALEKAQVDRVLQIKAVLTPEQFKQFERMQAQRNQPEAPMQNFQGPGQMMPRQGFQGRQFQGPQGFDGQPDQQAPQGQNPRRR